jgi:lipid-binding SYLF domain-containing protein
MNKTVHLKAHRYFVVLLLVTSASLGLSAQVPSVQPRTQSWQQAARGANKTSDDAVKALRAITANAEKSIPQTLLDQTVAVGVFPHITDPSVTIGVQSVRGVLSLHSAGWGNPIFFKLTSPLPKTRGETADLILLFAKKKGVESLRQGKFELSPDAGVVAGPIGQAWSVDFVPPNNGILAYLRTKEGIKGIQLENVTIEPDNELNLSIFGVNANTMIDSHTRLTRPDGIEVPGAKFNRALHTLSDVGSVTATISASPSEKTFNVRYCRTADCLDHDQIISDGPWQDVTTGESVKIDNPAEYVFLHIDHEGKPQKQRKDCTHNCSVTCIF